MTSRGSFKNQTISGRKSSAVPRIIGEKMKIKLIFRITAVSYKGVCFSFNNLDI
jgi:hypothetical protein